MENIIAPVKISGEEITSDIKQMNKEIEEYHKSFQSNL